jgi:hypothetical protein
MTDRQKQLDQLRDQAVEYLYGEMDSVRQADFLKAMESAPELADEFAQLRTLKSKLDALESPAPPSEAVANIMVMAEKSCTPKPEKAPSRLAEWLYWLTRPQVGMGLAALLVVAVGLYVTREMDKPIQPGSREAARTEFKAETPPAKAPEKLVAPTSEEKLEEIERTVSKKAEEAQPATPPEELDKTVLDGGIATAEQEPKEEKEQGKKLDEDRFVGENLLANLEGDADAAGAESTGHLKQLNKRRQIDAINGKLANEKSVDREEVQYRDQALRRDRKSRTASEAAADQKDKAPLKLVKKTESDQSKKSKEKKPVAGKKKKTTFKTASSGGSVDTVALLPGARKEEKKKEEKKEEKKKAERGMPSASGLIDSGSEVQLGRVETKSGTSPKGAGAGAGGESASIPTVGTDNRSNEGADLANLDVVAKPAPKLSDGVAMQGEHPQPRAEPTLPEPIAKEAEDAGVAGYDDQPAGPAPVVAREEPSPKREPTPTLQAEVSLASSSAPAAPAEDQAKAQISVSKKAAYNEEVSEADESQQKVKEDPLAHCAQDWQEIVKLHNKGQNNAALYLLGKFREGPCKSTVAQSKMDLKKGELLIAMKRRAEARKSLENARKANDDAEASEKASIMIDSMK